MAEIVLGIGASHSPQVSTTWEQWPNMRRTEERSPTVPANLDDLLKPGALSAEFDSVQHAVQKLAQQLQATEKLDAIVIFGDDQHEQFDDRNMPAIAIYHGQDVPVSEPNRAHIPWTGPADQRSHISALMEPTRDVYPNATELAEYLLNSLTEQEFDVSRCDGLRTAGIGHAFAFLYQRLWPECDVPIVPIMLNTYYPPNQPTPKRSYQLGAAVRRSIEAWDGGERVAVIASGGLSHIVLDEPLDRAVLAGLQAHDPEQLYAVPRAKLRGGTSEILNWIALGGAVGPMKMTLIDYVAGYRSMPSTGCGMAFAYWTQA